MHTDIVRYDYLFNGEKKKKKRCSEVEEGPLGNETISVESSRQLH